MTLATEYSNLSLHMPIYTQTFLKMLRTCWAYQKSCKYNLLYIKQILGKKYVPWKSQNLWPEQITIKMPEVPQIIHYHLKIDNYKIIYICIFQNSYPKKYKLLTTNLVYIKKHCMFFLDITQMMKFFTITHII